MHTHGMNLSLPNTFDFIGYCGMHAFHVLIFRRGNVRHPFYLSMLQRSQMTDELGYHSERVMVVQATCIGSIHLWCSVLDGGAQHTGIHNLVPVEKVVHVYTTTLKGKK